MTHSSLRLGRALVALLLSSFCAACGSSGSAPSPSGSTVSGTPSSAARRAPSSSAAASTAPRASAAPSASASATAGTGTLPPELAALAPGSKVEAGPFAWPDGGSSAIVAAGDASKLVWKTAAASGEVPLPGRATSGLLKDVVKGDVRELVVFAAPRTTAPGPYEDPVSTWILGVNPKAKPEEQKPARMWRLELKVLGAKDEASLDAELGALGSLGPTTAPERVIARLEDATPAEFKALVGKGGVKRCDRQGEKRVCKDIQESALDAKQVHELVADAGLIAAYEPDPSGTPVEELQQPGCAPDEKDPKRTICTATVLGPGGGRWVFKRVDGALRLVEIGRWAEDT
ncbi:MAG: hypothetical protein U0414_30560 [Polyangiaceae bacterium]